MSTTETQSSWDFTPIFNLIQSLKSQTNEVSYTGESYTEKNGHVEYAQSSTSDIDSSQRGLGNFDRLWDHLGIQRDVQTPPVPHFGTPKPVEEVHIKDAYASDGALYYPPSSKTVKWRDDDGQDLTDIQPMSPEEDQQLTKTQRKKRNRKLRRAAELKQQAKYRTQAKRATHPVADDSEDSPPQQTENISRRTRSKLKAKVAGEEPQSEPQMTPKDRAAVHIQSTPYRHNLPDPVDAVPSQKLSRPEHNSIAQVQVKSNVLKHNHNEPLLPITNGLGKEYVASQAVAPKHSTTNVPTTTAESIKAARDKVAAAFRTPPQTPPAKNSVTSSNAIHESLRKQWPVADPHAALQARTPTTPTRNTQATTLRPPQTEPSKSRHTNTPVIQTTPSAPSKRHEILPLINQDSIERNWSLFLKVMHNFPNDRKHLVSPLQLSINRPTPNGIHVFVDASNIMIGFTEHLKRVRGIHKYARVPHVDLNFHALALLLERRRPVAKRVLAGSTPEVSAFEEARQVGYETCILDKVYKARELTERQKYFEGYASGYGSDINGSAAAPPQQPKWVEQAVDEILHLKICESVIDTPIPPESGNTEDAGQRPTMVVATGDAAEAEYSPGFLKMVERALKKGWIVEVMAFGKSVSQGYRRMAQLPMEKGGWGQRFKIIELDEYSEELFGEAM